MSTRPRPSKDAILTALLVRLAAGYVLAGAIAKLVGGTPADLPAALRDRAHGGLDALFQFVIGTEVFVALTALVAPRLGWPLVAAALVAFIAVLIAQVREGAASCGCLGRSLTVPPWVMIAVDCGLLAPLLAARPWRRLAGMSWRPWSPAVGATGASLSAWLLSILNAVPEPGRSPIESEPRPPAEIAPDPVTAPADPLDPELATRLDEGGH